MSVKCPKCRTENTAESKFCKECASPLTIHGTPVISVTRTIETGVEELTRGTTFTGRYEIVEELGAGGMGKVYRAFDKKPSKTSPSSSSGLMSPPIARPSSASITRSR